MDDEGAEVSGAEAEFEVIEESPQYTLGSNDDGYALWDKRFPGEPFERYSPDEAGYDQAYNMFRELTRAERAERQPWRPWIRWATMGALGLWVATGTYNASTVLLGEIIEAGAGPWNLIQTADAIAFRVWVGGIGALLALLLTDGQLAWPRRTGSLVSPLMRLAFWVLAVGMIAWIIGGVVSQLIAYDPRSAGGDPSRIPVLTRAMWALDAVGFRLVVAGTIALTVGWAMARTSPSLASTPPTGGSG